MSDRDLVVGVMLVCLINGIFSPALLLVLGLAPLWVPTFLASEPGMIAYFSSLIVSTLTLMLSGVPAALFERFAALVGLPGLILNPCVLVHALKMIISKSLRCFILLFSRMYT
jgi:hypothetical protein